MSVSTLSLNITAHTIRLDQLLAIMSVSTLSLNITAHTIRLDEVLAIMSVSTLSLISQLILSDSIRY
jgi:hypothetical protein